MSLPPGQRAIDGFPRFGTHLAKPPPAVPADPALGVGGAVAEPLSFPLAQLGDLPRRELDADFHCVAGWSATGLRWEGVPFADFYREVIEARARPDARATHVVFRGLDGYWSHMTLEDALAGDVLLAESLNGRPLDGDHGAPLRLVCPAHYGFVNAKHLCGVELRTEEPEDGHGSATRFANLSLKLAWFKRHPRARVWQEERHRHLPAWTVRAVGRVFYPPTKTLSDRGSPR